MAILVYLTSLLIIFSKYLDCYTTSSQITLMSQERNPLARKLMAQFGIHTTIWGILGFTILNVIVSVYLLFVYYNMFYYKVLYVLIGLFVSTIQFAVAHTNQTKRLNVCTRLMVKLYEQKIK